MRTEIGKIKLQKIVGNLFIIKASKIVHEWNGHLAIFASPSRYLTEKIRWVP